MGRSPSSNAGGAWEVFSVFEAMVVFSGSVEPWGREPGEPTHATVPLGGAGGPTSRTLQRPRRRRRMSVHVTTGDELRRGGARLGARPVLDLVAGSPPPLAPDRSLRPWCHGLNDARQTGLVRRSSTLANCGRLPWRAPFIASMVAALATSGANGRAFSPATLVSSNRTASETVTAHGTVSRDECHYHASRAAVPSSTCRQAATPTAALLTAAWSAEEEHT